MEQMDLDAISVLAKKLHHLICSKKHVVHPKSDPTYLERFIAMIAEDEQITILSKENTGKETEAG